MPTGRPKYYWDACIFIAWIKDEQRSPGVMEGVAAMAKKADAGEAIIITSVITRAEVLEATLTDQQKGMFDAALKRRFVQTVACDMRVADRAEEIRSWYKARGITMDTPDSIHLATALLYKVDCFYTFDGDSKKKRPSRAKLINLNGNVAGRSLRIEAPYEYPTLLSGVPSGFTSSRGAEPSDALLQASQSPDDVKPKVSQPEPSPPSTRPAAQAQRRRGSSPSAPKPPRTKK